MLRIVVANAQLHIRHVRLQTLYVEQILGKRKANCCAPQLA
jgi:hypothetical protein